MGTPIVSSVVQVPCKSGSPHGVRGVVCAAPGTGNNTAIVKVVVQAPQLSAVISGGNLVLSWPADAPGYVLERSANLVSPVWTEVTVPSPVIVNGRKTVTLPLSSIYEFFRLRATL